MTPRLAVALAVFALSTGAQPQKMSRIGYLAALPSSSPAAQVRLDAFRQGLRESGLVEGKNILIEFRSSEGRDDRLPQLAAELVHSKVDIILAAGSTPAALAAKRATDKIPIVFAALADPVAAGLVGNLGRPGSNVTGFSLVSSDISAKRLATLKELIPGAKRIAVLANLGNPVSTPQIQELSSAATALGLQLHVVDIRNLAEIDGAFAKLDGNRPDGMVLLQEPLFLANRARLVDHLNRLELPAISPWREYTQAGAFVSYGPSAPDIFRRSAAYVDRILKGARAGDLPVEQPRKFELSINVRTATRLQLTVPAQLRLQADELIE